MTEFRFRITVERLGELEENGDRVLAGFLRAHPGCGPVVDQSLATGELSVTFTLVAPDLDRAFAAGRRLFADGMAASGVEPAAAVSAGVSAVPAGERAGDRALRGA